MNGLHLISSKDKDTICKMLEIKTRGS